MMCVEYMSGCGGCLPSTVSVPWVPVRRKEEEERRSKDTTSYMYRVQTYSTLGTETARKFFLLPVKYVAKF